MGSITGFGPQLATVSSLAFGLLGLTCLYLALFLHEDEEDHVQNSLEQWWIRLDDKRSAHLSRQTRFLQAIARSTNEQLARLFGTRFWSLRGFTASSCCSVASLFLYLLCKQILVLFNNPGWIPENIWPERPRPDWQVFPLYLGLTCGFVVIVPLTQRLPRFRRVILCAILWFSGVILPTVASIAYTTPYFNGSSINELLRIAGAFFTSDALGAIVLGPLGTAIPAMVSFGTDLLFVLLTRRILETATKTPRPGAILVLVLLNLFAATLLLVIPLWVGEAGQNWPWPFSDENVKGFSKLFALLNLLDALVAFAFVATAIAMLLHRMVWPVLQRPVYALQKAGIARRRTLLATIGSILIGLAMAPGKTAEALKGIISAWIA